MNINFERYYTYEFNNSSVVVLQLKEVHYVAYLQVVKVLHSVYSCGTTLNVKYFLTVTLS